MRSAPILNFCISLILLLALDIRLVQGQNNDIDETPNTIFKKREKQEGPRHHFPLFNGLSVGINVADQAMRLFGQDYGAYEGVVEANLHNRFFPEWSFGVGSANHTTDAELHYRGKPAIFNRIGMSYNFSYNKLTPGQIMIGVRYGFSAYSADITNASFNDGYWDPIPGIELLDQKFKSHWIELNAGIRVQVWKNISMGWMAQFKPLLREGASFNASPWYIPGYGVNGSGFGLSYNIYYTLPFGVKKQ